MAKIDRVEDLPEWFDLEKYQGCRSLGAGEWLTQLSIRQFVITGHPDASPWEYDTRFADDTIDTWRIVSDPFIKRIQRDPLNSDDFPGSHDQDSYLKLRKRYLVKPLLVAELAWQVMRDQDAEKGGEAAIGTGERWKSIQIDSIPNPDFMDFALTPVVLQNYGYYGDHAVRFPTLTVNLSACDDLLIQAFSDWLSETRASQQAGVRKPRKPLYDRWSRYGLLPYLDLRIWALYTGTHIPINVIADAVGYAKGESSFSKTVVPLANSLIESLSPLEALAVAEAEARSKAPTVPETFDG